MLEFGYLLHGGHVQHSPIALAALLMICVVVAVTAFVVYRAQQ